MAGDTERGPGPSLFFSAVGSASRREEGGLIIADCCWPSGRFHCILPACWRDSKPKVPSSITNMCKQANLSKRMIRDSARQKGWAKAKRNKQAAPPPCSICMLRWPFFFFFLPFQNGEKIRNSRVLAYHGSKPFPPRFFMPALPRPLHLPPPLVLFCNAKEKGNACSSSIYGCALLRTCT